MTRFVRKNPPEEPDSMESLMRAILRVRETMPDIPPEPGLKLGFIASIIEKETGCGRERALAAARQIMYQLSIEEAALLHAAPVLSREVE